MKKIFLVIGSLFGLLLLAAIVVPLVVDVNKYRPLIITKANEMLNGKLELGKLSLSLWGRVKIDVDGLKVSDTAGRSVVAVKDASFDLPIMSLLTGNPVVRLRLVEPQIEIVKQKNGKLNAMTLMKEVPADKSAAAAASANSGTGSTGAKGSTEIPAMVLHSRITVLLQQAKLDYKDEITGDNYAINKLDFRLEDVSPSSNMPFELTADLDLLVQKRIKVTGPLVFHGDIKATSTGGAFEKATAKAALKLDGVEIVDPGLFHKKKGVALGFDMQADVTKDTFTAPKIVFRLADVEINAEATAKTAASVTTVNFKAETNRIDVAKLGDLSPLVGEYGLNGLVDLVVTANGPTDKLGYSAALKFNKIALNHESLKQPLEVNGSLKVVTNELQNLTIQLAAAKGFDFKVSGSMQNFAAPRFKFNLASNEMDLDGLLKASERAAEARKEHVAAQASGSAGSPVANPVVDYNAMLAPLHKIPMAAVAAGTIDFNLKKIKSTGVVIEGMQGQLALNNLMLQLKDFSMKIFDGSIKGNMSFNARGSKPEVGTNLTVAGLSTQKMVESSMPIARNTIKGVISAGLNIGGTGLNQADIIAAWKGNGTFEIKNAVFSTLDVGTQIKGGVLDKLPPPLKGKVNIPDSLVSHQGEYDTVNTKFALKDGVMNINEINGKAHPNQGLDLKGNGTVKLADEGLDLTLDIIDTYNMLHLDDQAKDSRYGHFALSPKVGCTIRKPCFDWGTTISKLAQNALKSQAQSQAKQAVQKALGDKVPGAGALVDKLFGGGNKDSGDKSANAAPAQPAPPAPKPADAVRGALKGLFGH